MLYANDKRPTNLPAFFASLTDNDDGTYSLVYYPTLSGTVNLSISANETEILGSPFTINIKVGGTAPPVFVPSLTLSVFPILTRPFRLRSDYIFSPSNSTFYGNGLSPNPVCTAVREFDIQVFDMPAAVPAHGSISFRSITDDVWVADHRQVWDTSACGRACIQRHHPCHDERRGDVLRGQRSHGQSKRNLPVSLFSS